MIDRFRYIKIALFSRFFSGRTKIVKNYKYAHCDCVVLVACLTQLGFALRDPQLSLNEITREEYSRKK